MSKNFDDLLDEALDNIRNDRKLAKEFLKEIATIIANEPESNKILSPVAAKHIETLQRSNEQLVKILGIKQKDVKEVGLSVEDKDDLFVLIQGNGTDG